TLQRLVTNFADTSRRKRLDLVLHTGHDADAFQAATSRAAMQDLVTLSPHPSRGKRLALVLHTGHDADAFQAATSRAAMQDLVTGSPNLVLMLEGRDTLDQMTAQVQALTL